MGIADLLGPWEEIAVSPHSAGDHPIMVRAVTPMPPPFEASVPVGPRAEFRMKRRLEPCPPSSAGLLAKPSSRGRVGLGLGLGRSAGGVGGDPRRGQGGGRVVGEGGLAGVCLNHGAVAVVEVGRVVVALPADRGRARHVDRDRLGRFLVGLANWLPPVTLSGSVNGAAAPLAASVPVRITDTLRSLPVRLGGLERCSWALLGSTSTRARS